jgi:hypothetical protein
MFFLTLADGLCCVWFICFILCWCWCICVYATRVEAGSNTSTVTLRVVGSDEKGSLESETVKNMVASPKGLGPEKDCAGKGQQQL